MKDSRPGGTEGAAMKDVGPPGKNDGAGVLTSRSLETKILLSGIAILVGIVIAGRYRMLPGAACGAAIAYGNFYLIRKIVGKAFSVEGEAGKGFVVQYVLKFLALVAVVYVAVRSGRFDLLGFLLGLSALILGVLLEAVFRSVETR